VCRDLSLENVMLTRRLGAPRAQANNDMFNHEEAPLDAYIIDLGSSCVAGPGSICPPGGYLYRGKLGYAPPEVVGQDPMLPIDPFAVDVSALPAPPRLFSRRRRLRGLGPGARSSTGEAHPAGPILTPPPAPLPRCGRFPSACTPCWSGGRST
jgi:serine/threonine protein kinase